jgi:LacI family transcriptional regulator
MSKTILYLQYMPSESARQKLQGAQKYANAHGWSVNIIEDCRRVTDISRLLKLWKPNGCIADCAGVSNAFNPKAFGSTPVVFLNRSAGEPSDNIASVYHNQRQSALAASKEIIRLGRSHFAFISLYGNSTWSNIRKGVFSRILAIHGFVPAVFTADILNATSQTHIQKDLRNFLQNLPKPSGVFAANDTTAREVISTANALGLSIPDDLAVVSIDNNELIAANITPSLSSVEINFNEAGFFAAQLLDQQMQMPGIRLKNIFFGPLRVVRRASSDPLRKRDACVEAARERIIHDAATGLTAADVTQMFPCSRRMAEIRFRKATGMSIGDAILEARFTVVLSLLKRKEIRLEAIADLSGWKSPAVLRQYFKRKTGISMREWRNRNN